MKKLELALTLTWMALLTMPAALSAEKKVTVCHVPPGNPANSQTISVSEAAVRAHLSHGDQVGACPTTCPGSCDDGNACTFDSCGSTGQCRHEPVSCDDGNTCTRDECNPELGCLPVTNDGSSCDDSSDCTGDDVCVGTDCRGTSVADCCASDADCDDRDPCTVDSCAAGTCTNEAKDCGVADKKCLAGYCNAEGECDTAPVSCDDSNVCTANVCDPAIGCSNPPTSTPPEAAEVSCADGADNDCDGLTDGADPDCCDVRVNPECAPQSND